MFRRSAHFNTELRRNGLRQTKTIKRRLQQYKSRPLKFKEAGAGGVRDGYPLKSGYFTVVGSCSVKTVADRHRYAAFHNKQ